MSDQSTRLVHEFTYRAAVSSPNEMGVGPFGHRQHYEMSEAVIEGPRLEARQLGSGADWMLIGEDGYMRMDVRIQFATGDGAVICARYSGFAEANEKMGEAMTNSKATEFSDQSIRTHWLLETGDPRYAWINRTVFFGEGRVCVLDSGKVGFEHRVYRLG